jgi:hypothetical protein
LYTITDKDHSCNMERDGFRSIPKIVLAGRA